MLFLSLLFIFQIESFTDTVWVHSYEEDDRKCMVFRTEAYDLPKIRYRQKIQFKKDGDFSMDNLNPSDKLGTLKGKWNYSDKSSKKLIIKLNTGQTYKAEIDLKQQKILIYETL